MLAPAPALDLDDPFQLAVRLLGDRWTLLILRDMIFEDHRTFRDLLTRSPEGISSSILSARLRQMVADGLLTQAETAEADQRRPYALTRRAIGLVPVLAELGFWVTSAKPPSEADLPMRLFYGGGPEMWQRFMAELAAAHLGDPVPAHPPVRSRIARALVSIRAGLGPIAC